ncbi:hypothetical protein FHR32_008157 [Streptosporangium album]|uniref:Uncharacterized protein n=1 Tax=Streptosporangium album TaxID=47479 RepID=A0A7W7WE38_9ACTN|nr:hypothetical protein [Streptosporangium album]MBB4943756.1 hypothetical protein [Streptosporangium album]
MIACTRHTVAGPGPWSRPGLRRPVLADSIGKPAPITDEVEKILGRPAHTYAEWVADDVAAFRG